MRPPFRCLWCEELVMPDDLMHSLLPGYHYACAVRCTVKDGTHEDDPPGLTKRQSARLVADYVNAQQWGQPIQPGRN